MLTPLRIGMSRKELEQRMKDIAKEEQETLEREKKANDEFLASVNAKANNSAIKE